MVWTHNKSANKYDLRAIERWVLFVFVRMTNGHNNEKDIWETKIWDFRKKKKNVKSSLCDKNLWIFCSNFKEIFFSFTSQLFWEKKKHRIYAYYSADKINIEQKCHKNMSEINGSWFFEPFLLFAEQKHRSFPNKQIYIVVWLSFFRLEISFQHGDFGSHASKYSR